MKRAFITILATVVIAAVFGGLVFAVLKAAHVSAPAGNTVQGLTSRRLWATATALLALMGVVIGGLALRRSGGYTSAKLKIRSVVALVAGLLAVLSGALNLALAKGGPGSGNGVIGGAAGTVLGLTAIVLSVIAFNRNKQIPGKSNKK
nr:DUF6223 family protein [uncultured Mucilaginibacter sp.]